MSKNRDLFIRTRTALVFTVVAIVVCIGPLHLVNAMLQWVEDEFDVDLRASWKGTK